jgi:hypothetical protein
MLVDQANEEGPLPLQLNITELESLQLHVNLFSDEWVESLTFQDVFGCDPEAFLKLREGRFVSENGRGGPYTSHHLAARSLTLLSHIRASPTRPSPSPKPTRKPSQCRPPGRHRSRAAEQL